MVYPEGVRFRKAKWKPMIKYNENEDYSDESFNTEREAKRRKKIFKNKRKNKGNKPYQLNRISRK